MLDLLQGTFNIIDTDFSIKNWICGDEVFIQNNRTMCFDIENEGQTKSFDLIFDFEGTCKWYYERGDYYQPDFWEPIDAKIYITLKDFISEDFQLDINNIDTRKFLINLIQNSIYN